MIKIKFIKNDFEKKVSKIFENIFYDRKYRNVVLTGGKTIKNIYKNVDITKIDKKKNFYFSDERCVLKKSTDSNFYNVKKFLFKGDINDYKIFRINSFKKNKQQLIADYIKFLPSKIDFMILSLGDDGHIASIFDLKDKKINSFYFYVKHSYFNRISLGKRLIKRTKKILILAKGYKKGLVLKNYLNSRFVNKKNYQLDLIKNAEVLVDKDAYKQLNNSYEKN